MKKEEIKQLLIDTCYNLSYLGRKDYITPKITYKLVETIDKDTNGNEKFTLEIIATQERPYCIIREYCNVVDEEHKTKCYTRALQNILYNGITKLNEVTLDLIDNHNQKLLFTKS